jgi:NADPH-dependent F420 reductase
MPGKMPIITILGGTGKEGKGLAMRWAAIGYQVLIGSRTVERALIIAQEINRLLGNSTVFGFQNNEAAARGEICVLTVPPIAHQQALISVKDDLVGKILIDATSRVDYADPKPPQPPSAAQQAKDLLHASTRVVAAFQNVPAKLLPKNLGQAIEAEVFVCADDQQAAEVVVDLARAAGMNAYYAGSLENAVVVEGITALLIHMNKYYGVRDAGVKITGIPKKPN